MNIININSEHRNSGTLRKRRPKNAEPKIDRGLHRLLPKYQMGRLELPVYIDRLKTDPHFRTIYVWREMNIILDSPEKYAICKEHGIPYSIKYVSLASRDEAKRWSIETQLLRNNLNTWQRCRLVIQYWNPIFERLAKQNQKLSKGRGKKGRKEKAEHFECFNVNQHLSEKAHVSKDTIAKAKFILNHPDEDVIKKLEADEDSINRAYSNLKRNAKMVNILKKNSIKLEYINDLSKGIENNVICIDAVEGVKMIPDGSVTLCCCSPPFNVSKPYKDGVNDDKPHEEHMAMLSNVFRILKPKFRKGGRCIIEYQQIRTRGKKEQSKIYNRPVEAEIINMMLKLGYLFRTTIIWDKGKLGRTTNEWGSLKSPSNPAIRTMHSYLFVFSVDDWKLPCVSGDPSQLRWKEYDENTRSIWRVPIGSPGYGSHCCPMPVPLAERAIRTFSFKNDLVVDPFGGSGTTAVAALRNHRRFVHIDLSQTYCAEAQERIEQEIKKLTKAVVKKAA